MKKPSKRQYQTYFKGIAMGAADVIPGVSGGTVALITGIYSTLVDALNDFNLNKLRAVLNWLKGGERRQLANQELLSINWGFLIPLGLGIVTSILVLSKGMVAIMDNYPAPTYAFFFGLILVSIRFPYQEMKKTVQHHIVLVVFAILAFAFFSIKQDMALDAANLLNVFLGGAVAVCALILPGISGSTFLVIMGLYRPILAALHARDLLTISVFMSGMIIGILTFIRVLNWCLKNHKSMTMAALSGLMLGSLKKVWPYEAVEGVAESQLVLIACAGFGVLIVLALDKIAEFDHTKTHLSQE